jgi:hypothetical protein
MKKILAVLALCLGISNVANADTWYVNGVLYGNVCRSGIYYTVYPYSAAQPVGTSCPIRNGYGYIVGYGFVSNE